MRFLLIANPENRRAEYFLEACARLDLPSPKVVSWLEVLRGEWAVDTDWDTVDAVRIESPGENFLVERQLIARGAEAAEAEEKFPWLREVEALRMAEEHGRLRLGRQWFHGWILALAEIRASIPDTVKVMNAPEEIGMMFDKLASQELLEEAGVDTAERFGIIGGFDELLARLEEVSASRVFLKPCHGSSASGVVAFEMSGRQMQATTSVAMEAVGGELQLFNSLQLSRYREPAEVRQLVDALAGERLFVERWIPKAGHDGRVFDLRVLVIAGEARHVVMRTSGSPITNLHLGNARGDVEELQSAMGEERWSMAMSRCESAAAVFPACHYVAVDLMVGLGMDRFCVAEVNAFGDLIPRIESRGENTYEAELAGMALG